MKINLELYRIFYITATLGSFSKAAKELYTSQPAISQSIKQLESQLGGDLFYRNPRGVSLTCEGKVLYRYIEKGYNLIQEGEHKYAELRQMSFGQLRLAVCGAVCKHDLLDYITAYNHNYPGIFLSIIDESSDNITKLLDQGKIDIGIINPHNVHTDNLITIKTLRVQDCFVVGSKYNYLSKNVISLHTLAQNSPLIMLQKGGSTRIYMDEYFQSLGIHLKPQIELSHLDLIVEFAVRGLGVACVMENHVQTELKNNTLFKLDIQEKIPYRTLDIVIKKDMPISTAASHFISLISNNPSMQKTQE
jgi:DNA-binding transcriptional LysR family regulator